MGLGEIYKRFVVMSRICLVTQEIISFTDQWDLQQELLSLLDCKKSNKVFPKSQPMKAKNPATLDNAMGFSLFVSYALFLNFLYFRFDFSARLRESASVNEVGRFFCGTFCNGSLSCCLLMRSCCPIERTLKTK
jgi:hypothetical protein